MSSDQPPSKRLKTDAAVAAASASASSPTTFVTWNCNGLVSRCNWNGPELKTLLNKTDHPDILCLQEVRLKATSPSNRGIPLSSDYQNGVQQVMETTVFSNYDKFWSLADKKYAGTLTLLHKRLQFDSTGSHVAFSTQSAIDLLLKQYKLTRKEVGLQVISTTKPTTNNSKEASSKKKATQTSMKSFFAPKASPNKALAPIITTNQYHHEEGRFQFFVFPNMDLMQTYVPNNGSKLESFQRRREWDQDIKDFLLARQKILQTASQSNRPLLWCGDCNVAKTYQDGSHWQIINNTDNNSSSIYEWWKDETKCYASGQGGDKLPPNRHEYDKGLASFTEHERLRFCDILESADLSDVWRTLHPQGTGDDPRRYPTLWDRPDYTWRGHLSKGNNQYASKYEGKGQRIDYFLLSPSTLTQEVVESCDILGYGATREGFCGSDHCPHLLKLKKPL